MGKTINGGCFWLEQVGGQWQRLPGGRLPAGATALIERLGAVGRFIWRPGPRIQIAVAVAAEGAGRLRVEWQRVQTALTRRELDVLTLLVRGASNGAIGTALHISRRTVDKHVENLFAKTGHHNRTARAAWALAEGWQHLPEMQAGAALAIEEINQRGGVLGRPVDCHIADVRSLAAAWERLAGQNVAAITAGYFCADEALTSGWSGYRAPFLHTATLETTVRWVQEAPEALGHVFQTCASDVIYDRGLRCFLEQLQRSRQWRAPSRRLAIVQGRWPRLDIGAAALDGAGWQVHMLTAGASWDELLERLERLDPAVVVLACYLVEESIAFQRAFQRRPLRALLYKLYSPSVPVYRELLDGQAEGVLWAATTGLYNDPIARHFIERFVARHGRRPGRSQAGIAYDRIHMLATAWALAGDPRRFAEVNGILRRLVYRGVNGAYYMENSGQVGLAFPDDTHDPSIGQAYLVFQVQDGRQRIIAPAPYAESAFRPPPWCGAG